MLPSPQDLLANFNDQNCRLSAMLISIAFIIYLSIYHPFGAPPDYLTYIEVFDRAKAATFSEVLLKLKPWEHGFMLFTYGLTNLISNSAYTFLIFVLLASALKLIILYRLASCASYSLALILFFFKYLPLQDYNQIRAALAISLLMLAYYAWLSTEKLWALIVPSICAIFFHYLALAIIPFLLVICSRIPITRFVIFFFGTALFSVIASIAYVILYSSATILPRIGGYINAGFDPAASSYFSPVFYPEFFAILMSLIFWKDCTENMKRIIFLQLIGFAIFYGLFDLGVIGIRVREAISVFWLFYIVDYSKMSLRIRSATVLFVFGSMVLGLYLFYFSDFYIPLIKNGV
jgi:hypothetical protein